MLWYSAAAHYWGVRYLLEGMDGIDVDDVTVPFTVSKIYDCYATLVKAGADVDKSHILDLAEHLSTEGIWKYLILICLNHLNLLTYTQYW